MISGICIAMTRNSMYIYLKTLIDWKQKGFRDKLQMIDITNKTKQTSLLVFNLISTFIICVVLYLISLAFYPNKIIVPSTNGGMLLLGLILCWITCYLVAILMYVLIDSYKLALMITLLIYFTSMYFLGLGFPFSTITEVKWLNILIYLHPMRYSVNIVQAAYVGAYDFHYVVDGKLIVDFGYNQLVWLPYILSLLVIIICLTGIVWKTTHDKEYKINSRSKIKKNKSESKAYIKRIKETNDIELLKEIREDRIGEI